MHAACGEVQKVGYRDLIQEIARSLNVKGYVENEKDGSVGIICEAEESALQNFIQQINIKGDIVAVESIEIAKTQPTTEEFQYFDIKYGPLEEEIGEGIVPLIKILKAIRQDIRGHV